MGAFYDDWLENGPRDVSFENYITGNYCTSKEEKRIKELEETNHILIKRNNSFSEANKLLKNENQLLKNDNQALKKIIVKLKRKLYKKRKNKSEHLTTVSNR